MPFKPKPAQPDFEKLRSIISTSAYAIKDKSLQQVLTGLLDQLKKFQRITVDDIEAINNILEAIDITINNIVNNLQDASFLTAADETLNFPSSIQLLAGDGVSFDDSVANQRTVDADLPVGTIFSTWVNINPGILLGYGTWTLLATGEGLSGFPLVITVT